jgi:hypothetical protein
MQNEITPTEGQNSTKLEAESALRDAACCASLIPGDAVRVKREGRYPWEKTGTVVSSSSKEDIVKIPDMINGKKMFVRFRNSVAILGGHKLTLTKL